MEIRMYLKGIDKYLISKHLFKGRTQETIYFIILTGKK